MRSFRAETARIIWAPTLDNVRAIANEYGREPDRRKLINRLKRSKDWRNVGALNWSLDR